MAVHCGSPLRATSGHSDHRVGGTRLRDLKHSMSKRDKPLPGPWGRRMLARWATRGP
jgi:hypothetical protein